MTESLLPADLTDYQARDPEQALDAALAAVRSYCGWHITPSISTTVTVWSTAGNTVWLPTANLTAVTSVTQNGVTIAPATYTFKKHGVIGRNYGSYFGTTTPVTVVFVHGYDEWPADAKEVVLALAQRWIDDSRGLESKKIGPFSETYGPKMDQAQRDDLAPYVVTDLLGA